MNFISHYYFDRHIADSWFAIGVSTPDLLSIFNRGVRLRDARIRELARSSDLTPAQQSFYRGVLRHFDGDKVFHSSAFFETESHTLSAMLRDQFRPEQVSRSFFVSHVLLELIIDKILIEARPSLLPSYYAHFEQQLPQEIAALTEWIADTHLPQYKLFIERFVERKFLYHYTDWNYVVYVMKRILDRVGVRQHDYLDEQACIEVLQRYETHLRATYEMQLDYLEARLHETSLQHVHLH